MHRNYGITRKKWHFNALYVKILWWDEVQKESLFKLLSFYFQIITIKFIKFHNLIEDTNCSFSTNGYKVIGKFSFINLSWWQKLFMVHIIVDIKRRNAFFWEDVMCFIQSYSLPLSCYSRDWHLIRWFKPVLLFAFVELDYKAIQNWAALL